MRILLIKQSSLGDLIHCFPALSDAQQAIANIRFDWVVDRNFSAVPSWHPAVEQVIPIDMRQWGLPHQLKWHTKTSRHQRRRFKTQLQQHHYDLIIDAQALFKSALVCRWAKGVVAGFDGSSIRTESVVARLYKKKAKVDNNLHAIERIRQLFEQVLDYRRQQSEANFAIQLPPSQLELTDLSSNRYMVGLHATTWASKCWPVKHWIRLAQQITQSGYIVYLPWHNSQEFDRAHQIRQHSQSDQVKVLPQMGLNQLAHLIAEASGVIAVDTGLAHISAALGVPTVCLFGSSNQKLTAALGKRSLNLQSSFACSPCQKKQCQFSPEQAISKDSYPPCYQQLSPQLAWQSLQQLGILSQH